MQPTVIPGPGEVLPGQQVPLRGFTTPQLLHLAAQIIQNKIYQPLTPVKVKGGGGATEDRHVLRKNLRDDLMAQFPGMQLPDRVGPKSVNDLIKAGWVHNGREENAFGPANAQGLALEAYRQQLYNFINQNFVWLADQRLWPRTRPPGRGTDFGPSEASSLDELFRASGYRINEPDPRTGKNYRRPETFQERIQGIATLFRVTNASAPPGAGVRSARGAAFQRTPANQAQLAAIVNGGNYGGKQYGGINGFIAEKFAHFLGTRVTARLASETVDQVKQVLQDFKANRAPILAGGRGTEPQMRDAIIALGNNPAELHARFLQAFQNVGGAQQVSEYLWTLATKSTLNALLSGYKIAKPQLPAPDALGKPVREWLHDIPAQANNNGQDPLGYSRFVFDTLLATYIARGGGGDLNVDASSLRRKQQGPKGILGVNDKSIQALGWNTAKERAALASFIRKAKQNQYSMAALLRGAQILGIEVPQNATLHDAVIAPLREAVVGRLGPLADQGDALSIKAVGAALGITKADLTPADLRRKVDAMNGKKTTRECNSDLYTRDDLKRIAKANNVALRDLTSTDEACAQLAQVPVEPPSAQISGRRQERETQPSGVSSSRRREAGGGALINQLQNAQLPQYSPGTMAAFQGLLGGAQGQGVQQPMGQLSGGRLSSGRAGGSRLSHGHSAAVVNPATGHVLSGTRGQRAQSGLGTSSVGLGTAGAVQEGAPVGQAQRFSGGLGGLGGGGVLPSLGQQQGGGLGGVGAPQVGQSLQELARLYGQQGGATGLPRPL